MEYLILVIRLVASTDSAWAGSVGRDEPAEIKAPNGALKFWRKKMWRRIDCAAGRLKEGWVSSISPTNPRSPGRRGAIVVIGLVDCADKLKSGRALEFDASMRIFWYKRITSDRADRSKVRQMAHQNFGAKKI